VKEMVMAVSAKLSGSSVLVHTKGIRNPRTLSDIKRVEVWMLDNQYPVCIANIMMPAFGDFSFVKSVEAVDVQVVDEPIVERVARIIIEVKSS
jgi:hypothetical protein